MSRKQLPGPDKLANRQRVHLLHHAAAVKFDGDYRDAELVGDLFVEQTLRHQTEDLALPRRECGTAIDMLLYQDAEIGTSVAIFLAPLSRSRLPWTVF
jgi:hypothetical protein